MCCAAWYNALLRFIFVCTAANFSDIVNPAMHLHWMYAAWDMPRPRPSGYPRRSVRLELTRV